MIDQETIAARMEITHLKARHLRQLDTKDWGGFAALLTEDFELDIAAETSLPVIKGREAAMAQVQGSMSALITAHQAHPPEFEFKGNEAHVVWAMQDRIVVGPTQPSYRGYGHHHDRWVRKDGTWKLAAQRVTRLHVDVLPPAAQP
jgi:hypothetical protein